MSNDPNVQFDASRFYDFVASMDKKTLNKAERDALRKSVRVVATQTRRNLRGRWPGGTSTRHGRRPSEGIVANVQKATTGQLYGQVHIMGNGRSNSRGYLLRFFEMGTVDRFARVRSRAYRGRTVAELRGGRHGLSWPHPPAVVLQGRREQHQERGLWRHGGQDGRGCGKAMGQISRERR